MQDCIFCKIGRGELPSAMLFRDNLCFVIRDIHPLAPAHLLVIPFQHVTSLVSSALLGELLLGHLTAVAAQSALREGLADTGYRLVVNQGPDSGSAVAHLHIHVLGGKRLSDHLG